MYKSLCNYFHCVFCATIYPLPTTTLPHLILNDCPVPGQNHNKMEWFWMTDDDDFVGFRSLHALGIYGMDH